jgi:uncharacterized protein YkwD
MRYVIALLLCLSFLAVADARGRRSFGGGSVDTSNEPMDEQPIYDVEVAMVRAVNAERARFGLAALVLDRALLLRTRQHCWWMARNRSMVHASQSGAENVAMGQQDVDDVVQTWMGSSGHRANMLNPGHTRAGMTGYVGEDGQKYWCQRFE